MQRREFLQLMAASMVTPFTLTTDPLKAGSYKNRTKDIFPCSLSSGDPSDRGVVLWTKLNKAQVKTGRNLYFSISKTRDFKEVLYTGYVGFLDLTEDNDYTVKVDLSKNPDIKLSSNTHYYYKFMYTDVASNVGRFKTLPSKEEDVERLNLGVVTCQDYSSGFYTAYRHLAAEDVDFVVHLGDFVYEYDSYPHKKDVKRKVGLKHETAINLEDFRKIHETYRQDPHLQKALEEHTFIYTWDDHETANDHHYDRETDSYILYHDHPLANASPEERRELALCARKAWLEHMPVAFEVNDDSDPYNYFKIYKKYHFGSMLDMVTTDSRTYREPNEDMAQATMLGLEQKDWLIDSLLDTKSHWRVWANQTLFSELAIRGPVSRIPYKYINEDAWDGFRSERKEILDALEQNSVDNLVVLTGDMHTYLSSYVKTDYKNLRNKRDNRVGIELMTPSVSSNNLSAIIEDLISKDTNEFTSSSPARSIEEALKENIEFERRNIKSTEKIVEAAIKTVNSHIHSFNSNIYGYMVVSFFRDGVNWKVYDIDRKVEEFKDSKKKLHASEYFTKDSYIKTAKDS